MEPTADGPFGAVEQRAARTVRRRCGTSRRPPDRVSRRHAPRRPDPSRRTSPAGVRSSGSCSSACPDSVALRASIVIGARSRSFRFLVRLVERLPVLAVPAWHDNRTQPIDERDIVAAARAGRDQRGRRWTAHWTSAGPDVVTYGQLIDRIRDLMLVARPTVSLRAPDRDSDREPDRGADRGRAARAGRSADGEPGHGSVATRSTTRSSSWASGCTASTRRSSTRCACGRASEPLTAR